ncbi:hypothetical protein DTO164E3_5864 [Paecilomyces variotii]|nr:hypothetical protein DTO032I3_6428 [Paecilomyces variotii]KAJ9197150.1 hypothetical protein DTO164E3_5864 [Paecilomyces variotii]KAJ9219637.1 hypothetical protein DTO169C6_8011 [Paecilomyces variotii]KAJ9275085.1 hypothetical protein DTO021D3_8060 [Paecilomyces variotii]KAJ9341142.1 hypothetical protein DTO027B6_6274 [Paecilomyces variotii]
MSCVYHPRRRRYYLPKCQRLLSSKVRIVDLVASTFSFDGSSHWPRSIVSLAQLAERLVLAADILAVRSNLTSSLTSFLLFERFVPLVRVFVNNLWLPKTSSFK